MLFMISYKIYSELTRRKDIETALETVSKWRIQRANVWFVDSDLSLKQITDCFTKHFNGTDQLIIIDISGTCMNGLMPQQTWNDIVEHRSVKTTKEKSSAVSSIL